MELDDITNCIKEIVDIEDINFDRDNPSVTISLKEIDAEDLAKLVYIFEDSYIRIYSIIAGYIEIEFFGGCEFD
ncbi:MAG: hypothetical protein PHX40_03770 [Bacilli bacterium]|nr:hypothetical protein [Bacilli bacterium]